MTRAQYLAQYRETVAMMNNIVDSTPKREIEESGFRPASVQFAALATERTRIALQLIDEEAGVEFKGWPK